MSEHVCYHEKYASQHVLSVTRHLSSAKNGTDSNNGDKTKESKSWRDVAIVMAVLCAIFLLISLLLAVNLLRKKWNNRSGLRKAGKSGHVKTLNNYPHNYNPLSNNGKDEYTERIPVYKSSPAV